MESRLAGRARLQIAASLVALIALPLGFVPPAAPAAASPVAPTEAAAAAAAASKPADYAYDGAGQLRGVSQSADASGARYSYDDAGNLTKVARSAAGALTVSAVEPSRAAIGAKVTVSGTGFSATAASNTVKFNGTTAPVTSATTTKLVVTVPSGTTSGTVTVGVGSSTAASEQSFMVAAPVVAPTVTGVTGRVAAAGDLVTLTGTGFDPNPAANNVSLGRSRARVTAASSTSLTMVAPVNPGQGAMTVVTAGGSARSDQIFYGVPAPFKAADLALTNELLIDELSSQLTISQAGKFALLRFYGTTGQRLSLGLWASTMGAVDLYGVDPYGAPFGRDAYGVPQHATGDGWVLPVLPVTGWYGVVLRPSVTTDTGQIQVTLSSRQTGTLSLTGPGTTATLNRPGQLAEFSVDAAAGQRIGLGFTNVVADKRLIFLEIREPNGTSYQYAPAGRNPSPLFEVPLNGGKFDFTTSNAGRYTILLGSEFQEPVTVTVTASPILQAGSLAVGAPVRVSNLRPGQDAQVTFTGTAGQQLAIDLTDTPASTSQYVSVVGPTGTVVAAGSPRNGWLDIPALTASGAYTVTTGSYSWGGSVTLNLLQRQSTGSITATSAGFAASFPRTGVYNEVAVAATAGKQIVLAFSGRSLPTTATLRARLIDPSGAVVADYRIADLQSFYFNVTTTGNHRLLLTADATGSVTVTETETVNGGSLTTGTAATITAARIGQGASYTFTATTGQHLSVDLVGSTFLKAGTLILRKADGTLIRQWSTGKWITFDPFTIAGTYTLQFYPAAETGSVSLTLRTGADAGTTTVDGATKTLTAQAGGYAETGFTVGSSGRVGLAQSGITFTGQQMRVLVLDSTGRALFDGAVSNLTSNNLWPLTPGSYRLAVLGTTAGAGAATVNLTTPVNGGTMALNAAKTMTAANPGQATYYTYTASAAQKLALTYTAPTMPYSPWVDVRQSNGAPVTTLPGNTTVNFDLPAAGSYEITLNPYAAKGSITATLKIRTTLAKQPSSAGASPLPALPRTDPPASGLATRVEYKATPTAGKAPLHAGDTLPLAASDSWQPNAENLAGKNWSTGRATNTSALPPLPTAPAGTTAIAGRVLTLDDSPLANVTVGIEGVQVQTDEQGRFLITGVKPGHRVLRVDGASANSAGRTFGLHDIGVDLTAGQTLVLPYTIWLAKLDTAHEVSFASPTTHEVTIGTPAIPGLEVKLPTGAVIRDVNGKVVTKLGITAIPVDRTPFPLPKSQVPSYFTVQPGSSYIFPAGARVIYPNFTHAKPGAQMDFWHYDPADKGWFVYGKGTVTKNGKSVEPNKGTEVYQFTGAMLITLGADLPPAAARVPGGGATGADPVDLGSGLLIDQHTDLSLDDTMPISLTRTYQQSDTGRRQFGIGSSSDYSLDLYSTQRYLDTWLILPDGGRVHYRRITPGGTGTYDYLTAAFTADPTPTQFAGSVLAWNGNGWDLRLRNGLTYLFGVEAPLQAIRDQFGNQITITREPTPAGPDGFVHDNGPITQITSPNGKWIKFANEKYPAGPNDNAGWPTPSRVTQAQDVLGRTVKYAYTTDGRLFTVTDVDNGVTTYGYDTAGRLKTIKDARDTVYLTNEYDANGRVKTQTLPGNVTFKLAYTTDAGGKVTATELTDPRNHVRRVEFNSAGFTTSDTAGYGSAIAQKTTIERQPTTNLVSATIDQWQRRTEYGYDPYGNLTSVKELAGAAGQRITSIDRTAPFGQVKSVTDPLQHTTVYDYQSSDGALHQVTDPLNRKVVYDTNPAGQVIKVTDTATKETKYDYALGDLTAVTDPLGNITKSFTDAASRQLSVIDPVGNLSAFTYTNAGQVHEVTDPIGRTTVYGYDPNGNLHDVIDAKNHKTVYEYDTSDRLHTITDPLNRVTTYTYDGNGNLETLLTARGKLSKTSYDDLDRPTLTRYGVTSDSAEESKTGYAYDPATRAVTITDSAAGVTTLTPDSLDRLSSSNGPQGQVGYTYDTADRRATMTVGGQAQVIYGYNNADQPTSVVRGSESTTIGYDTAGRRETVLLPAGVTQTYGYDDASRVNGITYQRGSATLGAITYDRDGLGRLTHVGGSYARVDLPAASGPVTFDAADQQNGKTYDPDGNLAADGTTTYNWNARGQLTGLTKPGTTVSYGYDGLSRRTTKTTSGVTTVYLYDGLNAVQEKTGSTVSANLLTGGVDEVFSRSTSAGSRSLLTDLLGSTVATADTSTVDGEYSYDPFGASTLSGDDAGNPTRFTGREDDGSGLYYYRSRYYSTTSGQFLSRDPIGLASGSTNPYMYVFNQPTGLADPMGTKPKSARPGHLAETSVLDSTGTVRGEQLGENGPLTHFSGRQTAEEKLQGKRLGAMASHTEARSTRIAGSPYRYWRVGDDPELGKSPAVPGDTYYLEGELPPCSWCAVVMEDAAEATATNWVYRWIENGEENFWVRVG